MSSEYIENLKERLKKHKKEIEDLFHKNKLIKDILENALITILSNVEGKIEEQNNNFSLLSIDNISVCLLINIPFKYNDENIDLNKKDIINNSTSYISLLSYQDTMKKYIDNYKLDKNQLTDNIKK